jgi:hypothetical protein
MKLCCSLGRYVILSPCFQIVTSKVGVNMATKDKNIWLAILLNFVIPGLGYFYMGRKVLGVLLVVIMLALAFGSMSMGMVQVYGGISFPMFIVTCIDMAILHFKNKANSTKNCPFCGEHIRNEAVVCRFCSRELSTAA